MLNERISEKIYFPLFVIFNLKCEYLLKFFKDMWQWILIKKKKKTINQQDLINN